jgi:hypothetical protein
MASRLVSTFAACAALAMGCTDRELDVDVDPSFSVILTTAVSATAPVAVVDVLISQGTDDEQVPIRVNFVPNGVRAELSASTTSHEAQMLIYCSDPTPRQYSWTVTAENADGFAASDDFTLLVTPP